MAEIVRPVIARSLDDRSQEKELRIYSGRGFINVSIFVGLVMMALEFLGS